MDYCDRFQNSVRVNGEKFEKWPRDLFIPPDALEVFLETFQGPLDLLLYLIRQQNLDILDIPVARITRQYMEYVELMRKLRLDLASEYLVMAAVLVEIKSRMLLPRPIIDVDDESEDPRADLVRRLQEYERYSQAGKDMDTLPRIERDLYLVSAAFTDHEPAIQSTATIHDLAVAFRNLQDRYNFNKKLIVSRKDLSVREKMTFILESLHRSEYLTFEELFNSEEGRPGVVVCFIALLELVREDMLQVVQNKPLSPIHIRNAMSS